MARNSNNGRVQFSIDLHSGVPVYRQLIDQVRGGIASGSLTAGDQLPTVRQLAVDLEINPNTVMRAYRELELGGLLETHQGTGTFISNKKMEKKSAERDRQLTQMAGEFAARAGAAGYSLEDLIDRLRDLLPSGAQ
ncbi:MAG TPA: GntR family transcriptional regulator, partial [Candidatus Binatia bacterium]|nr:GntR family transcriptional regulator [Candidatus Binatia bacterium]